MGWATLVLVSRSVADRIPSRVAWSRSGRSSSRASSNPSRCGDGPDDPEGRWRDKLLRTVSSPRRTRMSRVMMPATTKVTTDDASHDARHLDEPTLFEGPLLDCLGASLNHLGRLQELRLIAE